MTSSNPPSSKQLLLLSPGFLLIDKPLDLTSNQVVQKLKRKIQRGTKIGHAGTLDPKASGLVLIGISREYTKQFSKLIKEDKEYIAWVDLSGTSETDDLEGPIEHPDEFDIDQMKISDKIPTINEIQTILDKKFVGVITQIPSKYSAIKIKQPESKSKRAYQLAREGVEFEVHSRQITIHQIEIIEYQYPILKLKIECSSGTYIRTLGHDIGRSLGLGGYLTYLRRTKIGKYNIENAHKLYEFD